MYFSHICHFRPMTQPNPLKTQIFDPFPTQPNPTQPNPRVNPTHGQLWSDRMARWSCIVSVFFGILTAVIGDDVSHCRTAVYGEQYGRCSSTDL